MKTPIYLEGNPAEKPCSFCISPNGEILFLPHACHLCEDQRTIPTTAGNDLLEFINRHLEVKVQVPIPEPQISDEWIPEIDVNAQGAFRGRTFPADELPALPDPWQSIPIPLAEPEIPELLPPEIPDLPPIPELPPIPSSFRPIEEEVECPYDPTFVMKSPPPAPPPPPVAVAPVTLPPLPSAEEEEDDDEYDDDEEYEDDDECNCGECDECCGDADDEFEEQWDDDDDEEDYEQCEYDDDDDEEDYEEYDDDDEDDEDDEEYDDDDED